MTHNGESQEVAPKKVRGALIAGNNFCITVGILFANVVCYSTQHREDSGSYRIPIAIQFLWALILGIGLFLLPESPRYFVKKGKFEQAAKALSSVRGQPIDSQYIKDELAEIIANHEYEKQLTPQTGYFASWAACFKGSPLRGNSNSHRTLIGMYRPLSHFQFKVVNGASKGFSCRCFNNSQESISYSILVSRRRRPNTGRGKSSLIILFNRCCLFPESRHHRQPLPDPIDHQSRQLMLDPGFVLDG